MSLEDFELGKELGKGAFGSVTIVKRKEDNKIYAMKRVKIGRLGKKEKDNSFNEVRLLASLNHKNIIGYKEAFFDDKSQTLNIVMEYADGGDLSTKIKQTLKSHQYFDENSIWNTLIQILEGLKYLHQSCIIHRDLKSANIFLTKNNTVKIGDLNVSKIIKRMGTAFTQTGTPYFASPEIWNDQPYDYKCDIWSVGCITYEMANLHVPFRGTSMQQLYQNVMKGIYPQVHSRYSNELKEIIKNILVINPKNRPSASELLNNYIIKKKMCELGYNEKNDEEKAKLMKTIKVPFNMSQINKDLPKKYENDKKNNLEKMLLNDEYETAKKSFYHPPSSGNYFGINYGNNNNYSNKLDEKKEVEKLLGENVLNNMNNHYENNNISENKKKLANIDNNGDISDINNVVKNNNEVKPEQNKFSNINYDINEINLEEKKDNNIKENNGNNNEKVSKNNDPFLEQYNKLMAEINQITKKNNEIRNEIQNKNYNDPIENNKLILNNNDYCNDIDIYKEILKSKRELEMIDQNLPNLLNEKKPKKDDNFNKQQIIQKISSNFNENENNYLLNKDKSKEKKERPKTSIRNYNIKTGNEYSLVNSNNNRSNIINYSNKYNNNSNIYTNQSNKIYNNILSNNNNNEKNNKNNYNNYFRKASNGDYRLFYNEFYNNFMNDLLNKKKINNTENTNNNKNINLFSNNNMRRKIIYEKVNYSRQGNERKYFKGPTQVRYVGIGNYYNYCNRAIAQNPVLLKPNKQYRIQNFGNS